MYSGRVYPSGIFLRRRMARGAKIKKQRILGAINQKAPAIPCVYACMEQINIAGAQTQETAIENAPRIQETFLSASRNVSLVSVFFLVRI